MIRKINNRARIFNGEKSKNIAQFSAMEESDFADCRMLLRKWGDEHVGVAYGENAAVERAFCHFEELGLEGGVLRADDKIVAFAIGEKVCEHTFVVHFEKASTEIHGAYAMINREFARQIQERYPLIHTINREDDMGFENIRQAKLSYHPDGMIEKYTVIEQIRGT